MFFILFSFIAALSNFMGKKSFAVFESSISDIDDRDDRFGAPKSILLLKFPPPRLFGAIMTEDARPLVLLTFFIYFGAL
jgi:hypothetical protein